MNLVKRGTVSRDLPESFAKLLRRLRAYTVLGWEFDSEGPTWPKIDREAVLIGDADVISSELAPYASPHPVNFGVPPNLQKHIVALDIDYPAYLVESSTEGHFHLYLDVPGGIAHDDYMALLDTLGRLGVVQPGYAKVSQERGHSDLRLPWVSKQSYPGGEPE